MTDFRAKIDVRQINSLDFSAVTDFILAEQLESGSLLTTLGLGALFGFLAYATYDLTNLATLRGYTVTVALVDMAWGTALTAVSATAGMWMTRAIMG